MRRVEVGEKEGSKNMTEKRDSVTRKESNSEMNGRKEKKKIKRDTEDRKWKEVKTGLDIEDTQWTEKTL